MASPIRPLIRVLCGTKIADFSQFWHYGTVVPKNISGMLQCKISNDCNTLREIVPFWMQKVPDWTVLGINPDRNPPYYRGMEHYRTIALIENDYQKRAKITNALFAGGFHVEPFEEIEEFIAESKTGYIVLLSDNSDNLDKLLNLVNRQAQWFPIIPYSETASLNSIVSAMLKGAIGYIDRLPDLEGVMDVINSNKAERQRLMENGRLRAEARAKLVLLTKREREVLQYMSEGMSNKIIGMKLGISPRTVEIHRANMISKLETDSTNEALRLAAYADF
ncbi:response regulator transcription factor [Novosphingobium beihaiensis]|uniref:LuxR C-terminal-related transcriptional regulator n=1 Tax=Novosphingobium beihaiensis TaxID=2930389 RepID=A0ABT0BKX2_9SPHN|nr:LuxR C-terminal-related transcriptional regulator [Novosphingobium beihaiensis]MCJ2185491.1 LuxR C-terminal-related transcriptional regulator [Novosphingobium beihaiensis]